jgi:hypothetical protein
MWKILVPSGLHIFLWLLANNKTLTKDNLAKRKEIDDLSCLFCKENEYVAHLFFNCCVARELWNEFGDILGVTVVVDFESMAKWLGGNRVTILNVYYTAVLWILWKTRKDLCFQGACWRSVGNLLGRSATLIRNWLLVNKFLLCHNIIL